MPSVGTAYVNVRVSTAGFDKSLESLLKKLSGDMEKAGTKAGKDFDRGFKDSTKDTFKSLETGASKARTTVDRELTQIGTSARNMGSEVSKGSDTALGGLRRLESGAEDVSGEMHEVDRSAKKASSSLGRAGASGGRAGGGFRQGGNGAGFFANKLKEINSEVPKNLALLTRLHNLEAFVGTAAAGLVGGLSAAAQGIFAIGANAAAAAPALAVLGNGLIGLAQIGAAVGISMQGVGAAITAGFSAADKSAVAAGGSVGGLGAATASTARAVRDAKEALSNAYRDAARAAADADRQVTDAEHALAQAQMDSAVAQKALNAARKEGIEQMQDIAFAAEDAGLAEQRAGLDLADAQQRLTEVSELAPDDRARVEAELAFKEAELNMREATDRREDADKAQKESVKKGIEGTDAMTQAHQDVADAEEAETQAERDLADARRDAARTAEDNAQRIADAQQAVADAQASAAQAQAKGTTAMNAATTATNAYEAALAKLSPQQRIFVERVIGLRDEWEKARNQIADPLFEGVNKALTTLLRGDLLGQVGTRLTETSRNLGEFADSSAKVAESPSFQGPFIRVLTSNNKNMDLWGSTLQNLAVAFINVVDASRPLATRFAQWANAVSESWKQSAILNNKTGDMQDRMYRAGKRVSDFFGLIKELWRWLRLVAGAADQASNRFGELDKTGKPKGYIRTLTDNLKEFNDALDKPGAKRKMIDNFTQSLNTLNAAGGAFKAAIIDPLLTLGQDKGLQTAFETISEHQDSFQRIADASGDAVPKLGELVGSIADMLADLSESGSVENFLTILTTVADQASRLTGALNDAGVLKWIGYITAGTAAFGLLWRATKLVGAPFIAMARGATNLIKTTGRVASGFKQGGFKGAIAGFKKDPKENAKAQAAGKSVTDAFAEGIRAGLPEKDAAMAALQENVELKLTTLKTEGVIKADATGLAIVEGLAAGIREGTIAAVTAAEVAGREVANAVAAGAQTQSPSRITLVDGAEIMEGLTLGIEEGMAGAEAAALTAGATVGNSVGDSAKLAAAESTAGLGTTMGTAVSTEVTTATKSPKLAGALGGFTKVFSGAAKGLGGAMRGLGGAMNFMMGPWGILIMILLPILLPLLEKLNDKFHLTDKAMDAIKWTLGEVADAFGWLWDVIKDVFGWLKSNWPLVLGIITGPIGIAVFLITKYWNQIWKAITFVFDWVKGNWPLILGIITGPIGLAVVLVIKYWDQILDFIKAVPGKIQGFLSGMWDQIVERLQWAWDVVQVIWDRIVDWIKQRPQTFKNNLRALWDMFKDGLRIAWDRVKEIWGRIVDWVKGRPKQFVANLRLLWDIFRTALSKAYIAVKGIWTRVTTWVKGRPAQFKSNLSALWDVFKDKLTEAWTWVQGKWKEIKTAISGWPAEMTSKLAGLWDGLGTGLKTAWNAVAGLIEDKVIGGINTVLGKFGVGDIHVSIPRMAEGGPIRGPGGPRADRVPIMASNGEFMMPARSARKLGPQALEYMRKHGEMPPIGGFLGAITGGFSSAVGALAKGPATAAKWIIGKAIDALNLKDNWLADAAVGAFKQSLDKVVSWIVDKQPVAVKGVAVSKEGWTYPLTHRVIITQVPNAGHNPANAVDLGAPMNTGVRAAASGTAYQHTAYGYGNYMTVSHAGGVSTLYAHLASFKVASGTKVLAGQIIALSDSTGAHTSGPHLHFELNPSSNTITAMAARGVKLGTGGVVAPSSSGTLALLAEAGHHERVTPLDSEGFTPAERRILESLESQFTGSGDTYHVHPSQKMNEAQLADMVVRRVAWKRRRGGGFR